VFDDVWETLLGRLEGITAEELAWEPVAHSWGVRPDQDGTVIADEHDADAAPGPVPTINWRLWHIAGDCLDEYSMRAFGSKGASVSGQTWHLDPGPVLVDLDAAYTTFRHAFMERGAPEAWAELGTSWGQWQRHNLYDLAHHALREVTHHAAEVALLRDLYRER